MRRPAEPKVFFWEKHVVQPLRPPLWFLPGPERMRGGAARRFASVRRFHRGSQAEATLRLDAGILESDQRFAESRSGRSGFPAGSQGSHLRGSQGARSHPWRPIRQKLLNPLHFSG